MEEHIFRTSNVVEIVTCLFKHVFISFFWYSKLVNIAEHQTDPSCDHITSLLVIVAKEIRNNTRGDIDEEIWECNKWKAKSSARCK